MIAFNVQVSVKDHCCQDKLGGDIYYTYSSHVKCNFFACVFWPKLWLLWHYDRILLSFITYITSSLSIDRSFPKKSTLWPYVIIMMQKGCTLCGILSTLILIDIIRYPVSVILSLIHSPWRNFFAEQIILSPCSFKIM